MAVHFKGQFELTLDEKGRVIIPSRLRSKIDPREDGEGFVATAGTAPCLWIFTTAEWEHIYKEMRRFERGSPELHDLQRDFFPQRVFTHLLHEAARIADSDCRGPSGRGWPSSAGQNSRVRPVRPCLGSPLAWAGLASSYWPNQSRSLDPEK